MSETETSHQTNITDNTEKSQCQKTEKRKMSNEDSSKSKSFRQSERQASITSSHSSEGVCDQDDQHSKTYLAADFETDSEQNVDNDESDNDENGASHEQNKQKNEDSDDHDRELTLHQGAEETKQEVEDSDESDNDENGASHEQKNETSLADLHKTSMSNFCKLPNRVSWDQGEQRKFTHYVLNDEKGNFVWDANHVRMPCDENNKIVLFPKGNKTISNRWDVIKRALERPIKDVFQLQATILKYNGHRSQMWDFKCLKEYFLGPKSKYTMTKENFFDVTLPEIIQLALQIEALFEKSIPLLKRNHNAMITMTQQQASCLLANAFLCTFPWRSSEKYYKDELPSINFHSLFNGPPSTYRLEKIKCIVHYFERVIKSSPKGFISYKRQVLSESPGWRSKEKLTQLHLASDGTIEDDGEGMLQVDFANKYVGGGVLGHGCVQEEIRFLICPEMIVSRLFTQVLNEREVLIMTGCERFSYYRGYSKEFEWNGDYNDKVESDEWERKYTEVVAMDAAVIRDKKEQYTQRKVERELVKAYCAFKCFDEYAEHVPAVCTGNWGCGAFGGDKQLKGLIQLIAASKAGRDVCFFTFGDTEFAKSLKYIHSKIIENGYDSGDLVGILDNFDKKEKYKMGTLFQYLRTAL